MRQRYIILQYVLWNRKNFHWLQRNKRSIQTLWLIILRCDGSGIKCKENFKENWERKKKYSIFLFFQVSLLSLLLLNSQQPNCNRINFPLLDSRIPRVLMALAIVGETAFEFLRYLKLDAELVCASVVVSQ